MKKIIIALVIVIVGAIAFFVVKLESPKQDNFRLVQIFPTGLIGYEDGNFDVLDDLRLEYSSNTFIYKYTVKTAHLMVSFKFNNEVGKHIADTYNAYESTAESTYFDGGSNTFDLYSGDMLVYSGPIVNSPVYRPQHVNVKLKIDGMVYSVEFITDCGGTCIVGGLSKDSTFDFIADIEAFLRG